MWIHFLFTAILCSQCILLSDLLKCFIYHKGSGNETFSFGFHECSCACKHIVWNAHNLVKRYPAVWRDSKIIILHYAVHQKVCLISLPEIHTLLFCWVNANQNYFVSRERNALMPWHFGTNANLCVDFMTHWSTASIWSLPKFSAYLPGWQILK